MVNAGIILTAVLLAVMGQLLLKYGTMKFGSIDLANINLKLLRELISQPFIVVGLLVFAISAFFWIVALSRVELSYAYPMVGLSYALIFLFSWLFFGENISLIRILGMIIIAIGVFVISKS